MSKLQVVLISYELQKISLHSKELPIDENETRRSRRETKKREELAIRIISSQHHETTWIL